MPRVQKCIATAAVLVVLTVLAACKLNVTTELYPTDLRAAMAGAPDISAPATMAFQIPSADDCYEHAADIGEIMAEVLVNFSPRGCESVRMESYLFADNQIPVVTSAKAWGEADTLFGVMLVSRADTAHIGVAIMLHPHKYQTVTRRMKNKFHQTVYLAASRVTLILNNDERHAVNFAVTDVFVDSEPAYGEHKYTLQPRHKAEIQLSDVAKAHLAKAGVAAGFTLRKSMGAGQ